MTTVYVVTEADSSIWGAHNVRAVFTSATLAEEYIARQETPDDFEAVEFVLDHTDRFWLFHFEPNGDVEFAHGYDDGRHGWGGDPQVHGTYGGDPAVYGTTVWFRTSADRESAISTALAMRAEFLAK